jgi:DNA-binding NarL/FixJ family response regulator
VRILVADDHETVRKGLCAIPATREEFKVVEAVNGREAAEKAREWNPDLVILDITMPVLDGFATAQEIRKHSDVPILFFTTHDSRQLSDTAKAIGVQGFVLKTQSSEVLLMAIATLLQRREFFPP